MPDDRAVILSREVINELTDLLAHVSEACRSLSIELLLLEQQVGVGPMASPQEEP